MCQQQGSSYFERNNSREDTKPRLDISENDDGTTELVIEVPGLSARNLSIEVENDHVLRISGTRTHRKNGYISQMEFNEAVRLKDNVDVEKIQSRVSKGTLTIQIPEKAKTIQKLPIQQSDEKIFLIHLKENQPENGKTMTVKVPKQCALL